MLHNDTPMLTANRGWTSHRGLKPGDSVFAPSGEAVRVIAVTETFTDGDCYEVEFSDGVKLVAGAQHLWRLRRKHRRRVSGSSERVVDFTEETADTAAMYAALRRGERLDVGVSEPLVYPVQQLPIHPYVLGAWLADGASSNGAIVCGDQEVFDEIERLGQPVGHNIAPGKPNCTTRTLYGLVTKLRECGVLNAKHIPHQYCIASIHQRMELLRGLMDCDGHCNARGTATFSSKHEHLAQSVYDLAASLALRPRIGKYAHKSGPYDGYVFWQVRFQAHANANPFKLKRKADRAIGTSHYDGIRTVKAINKVAPQPCCCIQVDGGMYLAGRELVPTRNSTILSFAGSIFRIIRSHGADAPEQREVTIGVFSHTKPIAKGFLRQIKYELETNDHLKLVFNDIFWENPRKEAPKWTEDEGITVKRKTNPKEATVEAHGLVDGQPTSKHYVHRQYDDVVTMESVTTPDMIAKTTAAYEMSDNLGTEGGTFSIVGTIYAFGDTYMQLKKRGAVKVREHPCTYDRTENFTPDNCVLMKPETLAQKRRVQGPYTFGTQMMLNPRGDGANVFRREWIQWIEGDPKPEGLNIYILVDPANEKRKTNDYTTFWVIGLDSNRNYIGLDVIRDRLNLTERTNRLFDLHATWKPLHVVYEKYGMQADVQHIRYVQNERNYRFPIVEIGGSVPKLDRIRRLIPVFESKRIYLRRSKTYSNSEGETRNLMDVFLEEEYAAFPVMAHDDMFDCLARIEDPEFLKQWPDNAWGPSQGRPAVISGGSLMRRG